MKRKTAIPDAYFEFGLASRRDEPRLFDRFHRHNEVELVWVERGRMEYRFSHGREGLGPGEEILFWGAMPHQIVAVEDGTVQHWLTVPLAWFLDWKLPAAFADPVLAGAVLRVAVEPDTGEVLRRYQRWHADLQSKDPARRRIVVLEAEVCVRRMALLAGPGPGKPSSPGAGRVPGAAAGGSSLTNAKVGAGPAGKIEAMAQFIARHYAEPLRVAVIAASAGLNAEYATTVFRQACGRSLIEYVTEHRVSHAQRLLATTDRKILDVAMEAGFRTPSRFYAAFEAACGCSPRAYRKRVAGPR